MNLNDYITKMKSYFGLVINQDEKKSPLFEKLGVSDNYPILLKMDLQKLVIDLENPEEFPNIYKKYTEDEKNIFFDFVNKGLAIQIYKNQKITKGLWFLSVDQEHSNRQIRDFNLAVGLHKKIGGYSNLEIVAQVIIEFAEYAIRNQIAICFPQSNPRGSFFKKTEEIVYYPN